jgi:hypothetical protein
MIVVKTTRAPRPQDGKLAIGHLDGVAYANRAKVKRLADKHGFQEVAPNEFVHKDGSWFKRVNDYVTVGVGRSQLHQAPPLWVPVDGSVKRDNSKPKIDDKRWAWFKKNTALGKTPVIAADAHGRATLQRKGYVLSSRHGGSESWVHPDGSWFKLAGYSVSCGWKGFALGQLPFQRW